jgi:ATP-binding cassette subfamily B protein
MAIVGSTGSGKSTIINLLMKFYDYQTGSIRLDQIELKDITKQSLRSHISLVLQDVFLFSGSIKENITLRNSEIDDDAIFQASKLLDAHRFIMALPNGYDFTVSERGHNLSSGKGSSSLLSGLWCTILQSSFWMRRQPASILKQRL